MNKRISKKVIVPLATLFALAACGQLGEYLGTNDSQNRTILADVATADETAEGDGTSTGTADACRRNPLKEACGEDAKTFCAELLPPKPGEGEQSGSTPPTFEERHEKKHQLVECLKAKVDELSTTCQDFVQGAPTHADAGPRPKGCNFRKGPKEGKRRGGPGHGGPGRCGGRSLLAACITDAQTLCGLELPTQTEVDPLTPEARRERVEAIVSCLGTQTDSVSTECQAALEKLPKSASAQESET